MTPSNGTEFEPMSMHCDNALLPLVLFYIGCLMLALLRHALSCKAEQHLCHALLEAIRLLTLFLRNFLASCEHPCSALARTSTTYRNARES